ncbi:MAG TPA: outer membrane beta-barrel protein [Verrucomicrobiae bacterium]|nr:outer membrane beta-barrel protein [Verrucomicrobiae bacterium]
MKFNKWTLGLAAVGAVSMASAVRADEAKLSQLNTALSNTTISGYVDVAAQYNPGDQPARTPIYVGPGTISVGTGGLLSTSRKTDNFTLNDVNITLDKPLDDSPWAAGYHVDLNAGHDAYNAINFDANGAGIGQAQGTLVGVRQAYVTMRTPVGNGIDWKFGAMDGVTGYESNTDYANPNYTRSYGYAVNPALMLGILGSYKVCNEVTVQMGLVNRGETFGVAGQNQSNLSSKDYVGTVALTAPDSWGFLKGSSLIFGTVQGFDDNAVGNYNVSATLNTPVTGLKFGLAYDVVTTAAGQNGAGSGVGDGSIYGLYATYQATDKLSFNVRGEYVDAADLGLFNSNGTGSKGEEITTTVEYDLWANVVTRAEFRWDHSEHGAGFPTASSNGGNADYFTLALNVIYKF